MQCEYCNKNFASKGNLVFHQKTAQFCLKIREQNIQNFTCEFCKSDFNRKSSLITHLINCKDKLYSDYKLKNEKLENINKELENKVNKYEEKIDNYVQRIEDYKIEINKLQNQILELAEKAIEKPTYITTNNNEDNRTMNNSNNKMIDNRVLNMVPMNLTKDGIFQALEEKFTENHLMKGQKGLAEFCLENILITPEQKFLMKCTDPSRKIFVYLDEEGKMQKDVNADKLTRMISEPVKKVSKKIYDEIQDRYFENQNYREEREDNEEDNIEDEDKLTYVTGKLVQITSLKSNNSEFVKGLIPTLT